MYISKQRSILIDLKSNKLYYSFMVSLNRCNGTCNTLDDLSNGVFLPSKIEDVNLNIRNMITITRNQKH